MVSGGTSIGLESAAIPGAQPAPGKRIVPGRACGSCSLCCKTVGVEELNKPIGVWCRHCVKGKGCGIYETRPPSCRAFICQWMLSEGLGPEWKPDRAKLALLKSDGGRHLTAFVDPGFPTAWRRSPYYENLKAWAVQGARNPSDLHLVDVMVGPRCTVILPDRDIDIGELGADEAIRMECKSGALEVCKVRRISAAA